MRWKYILSEDDPDNHTKKATLSLIQAWWNEFEKNGDAIAKSFFEQSESASESEKLVEWVQNNFRVIHPGLMWELGKSPEGKFVFVITPEENLELRSLADSIVELAPAMDNWIFSAYRLPEMEELVNDSFKARLRTEAPRNVSVNLKKSVSNEIDIEVVSSSFLKDNDDEDISKSVILMQIVLGEELAEKWGGNVTSHKVKDGFARMISNIIPSNSEYANISLASLPEKFLNFRSEIIASLPEKYLFEEMDPEKSGWAVLGVPITKQIELHAKGIELPDRITWLTMTPELVKALIVSGYFRSERFSKRGEKFCWIRSALEYSSKDDRKDRFDDFADKLLREAGLGCIFASGTGLSNIFFDLALIDVNAAVKILKETAINVGLPPESWLFFHDSHLQDEWIGLLPDSPPPEKE